MVNKAPAISVIVPVYRGKETLPVLVPGILDALKAFDTEVILVCDGCDQSTLETVELLTNDFAPDVKNYKLCKNHGQQVATAYGLSKAAGELLITMDEDLQHNPDDIPALIDTMDKGDFDLVYGFIPGNHQQEIRNVTSAFFRSLVKRLVPALYPRYSSFRLMKAELLKKVGERDERVYLLDQFLALGSHSSTHLVLEPQKDNAIKSSYSSLKRIQSGLLVLMLYMPLSLFLLLVSLFLIFAGVGPSLFSTAGVKAGPAYMGLAILVLSGIAFIHKRNLGIRYSALPKLIAEDKI